MKQFVLGFLSALLAVALAYGIAALTKWRGETLAYHITTVPDGTGRDGAFEVRSDGDPLFTYYVFGNGFMLSVPSDISSAPRVFFSQTKQNGDVIYTLRSARTKKDGSLIQVSYDMSTGRISQTLIVSKDGKVQAFDQNGNRILVPETEEANQVPEPTAASGRGSS